MPPEAQIPIALLEIIGGIVLIFGILSRISASMLAMNMIGAIFVVRGATSLTGEEGYEIDLILLAACLVVIVAGPGRVSISHIVKKNSEVFTVMCRCKTSSIWVHMCNRHEAIALYTSLDANKKQTIVNMVSIEKKRWRNTAWHKCVREYVIITKHNQCQMDCGIA